jgi:hypothetical protein
MKTALLAAGIGTAITFAAFAPNALAQENTNTYTCQDIGVAAPEPLGDREGHTITIDQQSCHVDSGPMSGGILTGRTIWEWNGPNAVLVSGNGVIRKPGATVVYVQTEGKLALTMADGKVTGFTASGKGPWAIATGSAASLAGKSATWTAKPAGPGQFTVEDKLE